MKSKARMRMGRFWKLQRKKEVERFARTLFEFSRRTEKFLRRLKYGTSPSGHLRMREYIRARDKLSGHHRI